MTQRQVSDVVYSKVSKDNRKRKFEWALIPPPKIKRSTIEGHYSTSSNDKDDCRDTTTEKCEIIQEFHNIENNEKVIFSAHVKLFEFIHSVDDQYNDEENDLLPWVKRGCGQIKFVMQLKKDIIDRQGVVLMKMCLKGTHHSLFLSSVVPALKARRHLGSRKPSYAWATIDHANHDAQELAFAAQFRSEREALEWKYWLERCKNITMYGCNNDESNSTKKSDDEEERDNNECHGLKEISDSDSSGLCCDDDNDNIDSEAIQDMHHLTDEAKESGKHTALPVITKEVERDLHVHVKTNRSPHSSTGEQNPWSYLWSPNHKRREFDFGDWDTYNVIGVEL
mmetsp:Transcript_4070/g.6178  ORF Transcript_4070/g.6178 Transcript_4070/m.6178 type:complete len:338 (-) Transcript_4070:448-1461(-)|eukprot:11907882-Ditylum_brightwellii.AAC.1